MSAATRGGGSTPRGERDHGGSRVVVGGEALVDLLPSGEGGADEGTAPALRPLVPRLGGGPYNTAIGLGRLGVPTSMLTRLSTDPFGDELLARLGANGVDDDLIQRGDEPTTLAVVTLDERGHARYSFHVEGTAERLVSDPGTLPADTAALALGSFAFVLEPGASAYAALLARADAEGLLVSVDPNIRAMLVDDPAALRERLDALVPSVGLLKLSDEDAEWWGRTADDLVAAGAGAVVLTRGLDGLAVCSGAVGTVEVPAQDAGPLVDTIGAGDSVHAALLCWLRERGALERRAVAALGRDDWVDGLHFAARVAAHTVARAGAEPPWRAELDA